MAQQIQRANTSPKQEIEALSPDAVHLLRQDHRAVEKLFKEFELGGQSHKEEVALRIIKELEIHGILEEEIFYPALQALGDLEEFEEGAKGITEDEVMGGNYVDDDDEEVAIGKMSDVAIDSAYADHQAVKGIIARMRSLNFESPGFEPHMEALKQQLMDHVAEEEEVLFVQAELKLDTEAIGKQIQLRKQELLDGSYHRS